jgi:hypothetical protein
MSNPTSNFGWQMPTPTDLVTDLPADFEVFGQAVDTDFVDLLGGTTGQVLSKTSNTDLDFTWIANDQGDITEITVTSPITGGGSSGSVGIAIQDGTTAQKGAVQLENSTSSTSTTTAAVPANVKTANDLAAAAIPKSTVTTNGDLIYGTGSAAVTRLGIGSTSQVLTVTGGVPSWATPSAAASGLTLVQRSSFSNVADTGSTFNGVFTSTYATYLVTIEDMRAATQADDLHMQLKYGTTTQTANYLVANPFSTYSATAMSFANSNNTAQCLIANTTGNFQYPGFGYFYISNVGVSSVAPNFKGQFGNGLDNSGYTFNGIVDVTNQTFTGLLLKSSSSNITGTVAIYGLAK